MSVCTSVSGFKHTILAYAIFSNTLKRSSLQNIVSKFAPKSLYRVGYKSQSHVNFYNQFSHNFCKLDRFIALRQMLSVLLTQMWD